MATRPIDFYFDLSSPFAYLSANWINDLAAKYDRSVNWRPIMLGVAFKETGMKPLFHQPLRGPYGMHDFKRSARLLGLEVVVPKEFPYTALKASRAFYWLEEHEPKSTVEFAMACFERYFGDGIAPTADADLSELALKLGLDGEALVKGAEEPEIKQRLKDETSQAIERGVFGAPFFFIDDEPFWGNDRKEQMEKWLKTGGW